MAELQTNIPEQTPLQDDPPSKASKLYKNLISDGYTKDNLGSEDEFSKALADSAKADKIYSSLISDGYTEDNLGKKNEFLSSFTIPKQVAPKPVEVKPVAPVKSIPLPAIHKAAIQNYENMQGANVKNDKQMAEVDRGNNGFLVPQFLIDLEDDIFGSKGKIAKTERKSQLRKEGAVLSADADKAREAVKPYVESALKTVNDNPTAFTSKSVEGNDIPDPYKIDAFAKEQARKAGVKENGYFKTMVYNEAMGAVANKIIEPAVTKRFDAEFKKQFGKPIGDYMGDEMAKGFTEGKKIESNVKAQVAQVVSSIKADSTAKVQVLNDTLTKSVEALNADIKTASDAVSTQFAPLIKDGKFAGTDEEFKQYQQAVGEVKKLQDGAQLSYQTLAKQFLNEQNIINTKANQRYRRQVEEISKGAQAKLTEAATKYQEAYKQDPKLQAKVEAIYKKAYSDELQSREDVKDLMGYFNHPVENMGKAFLSALGGSIKGMSSALNFDSGKTFGDFLESKFQPGKTEIKSFSDFADYQKVAKSTGQLFGGMAPSLVASAGAVALTRGVGGGVIMQAITSGAAGWGAETMDIVGRMKDDVFKESGDASKAEHAANESFKSQIMLAPTYALEGLPFMGKAVKLGKNVATRIAIGGAIEFTTEMLQEYPQNLVEEAIKKDGTFTTALQYHSAEKLENTALNIAPVFLLGAAGQVKDHAGATSDNAIEKQARAFSQKVKFSQFSPSQREQFLFDMMQRRGENFTSAYLTSSFAAGHIDKPTFNEMARALATSADIIGKAKDLNLTDAQQRVFSAFTFQYDKAKAAFEKETDPLLKKIAEQRMKDYEAQVTNFAGKKQADYAVLTYANNEQYVFTHQEMEDALADPEFAEAVKKGELKVSLFGKGDAIQGKLDALGVKPPTNDEVAAMAEEMKAELAGISGDTDQAGSSVNIEEQRKTELEAELPFESYRGALNSKFEWERNQAKEFLADPKAFFEKNIATAKRNLERDSTDLTSKSVFDHNTEQLKKWNEINAKYDTQLAALPKLENKPPEKKPEAAPEQKDYKISLNDTFKAAPIEIEGLEHLDLAIGKEDGSLNWKVIEIATGGTVAEGLSKEEAIANAKDDSKLKQIDYEKIENKIYQGQYGSGNTRHLNQSDKYDKHLKAKADAIAATPLLYSPEEIDKLQKLAERLPDRKDHILSEIKKRVGSSEKPLKMSIPFLEKLANGDFDEVVKMPSSEEIAKDEPKTLTPDQKKKRALTKAKNIFDKRISEIENSQELFKDERIKELTASYEERIKQLSERYNAQKENISSPKIENDGKDQKADEAQGQEVLKPDDKAAPANGAANQKVVVHENKIVPHFGVNGTLGVTGENTGLQKKDLTKEYPNLSKLTDDTLDQATSEDLWLLSQMSHPTDNEFSVSRQALLKEWEKRGSKPFEELGLPTQANYPYINKHTGIVSTLATELDRFNTHSNDHWWVVAEHYDPVSNIDEQIKTVQSKLADLEERNKKAKKGQGLSYEIESAKKEIKILEDFKSNPGEPIKSEVKKVEEKQPEESPAGDKNAVKAAIEAALNNKPAGLVKTDNKGIGILKTALESGTVKEFKTVVTQNGTFQIHHVRFTTTDGKFAANIETFKTKKEADARVKELNKALLAKDKVKVIKKRKKQTQHHDEIIIAALELDPVNPDIIVAQHFINGGTIGSSAIQEIFGGNKLSGKKNISGEIKARISYVRSDGPGVDALAHSLWDNSPEWLQDKYTAQDFREAVEHYVTAFNHRKQMAVDVMNVHDPKNNIQQEDIPVDNVIASALAELSDNDLQEMLDEENNPELIAAMEDLENMFSELEGLQKVEQDIANQKINDELASKIISDEGLTLENLEENRKLFTFPYTEEDYINVKNFLENGRRNEIANQPGQNEQKGIGDAENQAAGVQRQEGAVPSGSKNPISGQTEIDAAQKVVDKARKDLADAEAKVAKKQAVQADIFGNAAVQKEAIEMTPEDIKAALDPLKKKVKEAEAALDELKEKGLKDERQGSLNIPDAPAEPVEKKKLERKVRDEKLRKDIDDAFDDFFGPSNLLTSGGLDPEKIEKGVKLIGLYMKAGIYKFSDIVEDAYAKFGDKLKDYFDALKSVYSTYYNTQATDEEAEKMDANLRQFTFDKLKKEQNVLDRPGDNEPDSGNAKNELPSNEGDVSGNGGGGGRNGSRPSQRNNKKSGGKRSPSNPDLFSPAIGEQGNNELHKPIEEIQPADANAGVIDSRGNRIGGTEGHNAGSKGNPITDTNTKAAAGSFQERFVKALAEQKAAEHIEVKILDRANIAETLPLLLEEQRNDVFKAEERFFSDKHKTPEGAYGKGMLFTNGTGTGKTLIGLGVVKRFVKQGKKNILIIVPASKTGDWIKEGNYLGLSITKLQDTKSKGEGIITTSYQNFRANQAIMERDFDLILYDESHKLLESNKGEASNTTESHYLLSNKNEDYAFHRITNVHPVWIEHKALRKQIHEKTVAINGDWMDWQYQEKREELDKLEAREKKLKDEIDLLTPSLKDRAKTAANNTKVLFLSATPFKMHFNLRYANGYLFDWGNKTTHIQLSNVNSRVDAESQFMLDNFGSAYEWKKHHLQLKEGALPEAIAMQEIQFAEKMMKNGAISGRVINSEQDYSREFPLVSGFNSTDFNKAFGQIFSYQEDEFSGLRNAAYEVFRDPNYSVQLFESLKASMAINRIKEHLALGRKVVIFHRRQQANTTPPFRSILDRSRNDANAVLKDPNSNAKDKETAATNLQQADVFEERFTDLLKYEQTLDYRSAVVQIGEAFGDRSVFFANNDKQKAVAIGGFNADGSGKDVFVVQEESGKEGISLHDTTGKHQRVLMSLSMPNSTTTALQMEGRIYRIGQESDAIFEYPLLGLDLEIAYFGQKLNKKLSTTENLAVGAASRDLTRSYAEGVMFNSTTDKPSLDQGQGGKAFDRRHASTQTEFQKARLVYSTNQKIRGRRDQRVGIDYFPTPEPVGQKMVEWLGMKPGEHMMEPSAGHGAIAMWAPNTVSLTAIEQSFELYSKLGGRAGGASKKILNQKFEDYNIINKYDGIAMNPPWGVGGKDAIDHLEKAFKHLRDGGRIVALIPDGGASDKRLDKFLYGEDEKGHLNNPDAHLRYVLHLPSYTFEQAGTGAVGKIVIIDKVTKVTDEQADQLSYPQEGRITEINAEKINDLFDVIEHKSVPDRVKVEKVVQQQVPGLSALTKSRDAKIDAKPKILPITEHVHTRTGQIQYLGKMGYFLGDEYKAVATIAKNNNGAYSSFAKGFLFEKKADADKFSNEVNNGNENKNEQGDVPVFSAKNDTNAFQTTDNTPATLQSIKQAFPDAAVVQSQTDLPQAVQDEAARQGITVEGVYYQGKVYMVADNLDNMGRAKAVYRHERIGHQGVINELANKLDAFATSLVDGAVKGQLEKLNAMANTMYGKKISELTAEEKSILGQEYIAQIAEDPANYPKTWDKIVTWVREALRSLGINMAIKDSEIKVLLKKAAANKAITNTKEGPLFHIAGEKANMMQDVRDNLDVAREMETAGRSVDDIYYATGWERGADGKWRHELPDVSLDISSLDQKGDIELNEMIQPGSDLVKAYPELAKIKIVFVPNMDGEGSYNFEELHYNDKTGEYERNKHVIQLNTKLLGNVASLKMVLIHEIQHAIQNIEGFAQGGNERTVIEMVRKIESVITQARILRDEWNKAKRGSKEEKRYLKEYQDLLATIDWKEYHQLKQFMPTTLQKGMYESYQGYEHLAGEVEARNVEFRTLLTPEERKGRPIYKTEEIAREEQIKYFGSANDQQSSKPLFSSKQTNQLVKEAAQIIKEMQQQGAPMIDMVDAATEHMEDNWNDLKWGPFDESFWRSLFVDGLNKKVKQTSVTPQTGTALEIAKAKLAAAKRVPENKKPGFLSRTWSAFRNSSYWIDNPNRYITKLQHDIENEYGVDSGNKIPLGRVFEQNARGEGFYRVREFINEVIAGLNKKDIEEFKDYLFWKRIKDRNTQNIHNEAFGIEAENRETGNITLQDAETGLADMEKRLGAKKFADFERRGDNMQEIMDNVLNRLVESGRLSEEAYDEIKLQNDFYAPFNVVQTLSRYNEGSAEPVVAASTVKKIHGISYKDGMFGTDAINQVQEALNKGVITRTEFYDLSLRILEQEYNAGNISEKEFISEISKLGDSGFVITDILDKTASIIFNSYLLAHKNEMMKRLGKLAKYDTGGLFIQSADGFELRYDKNGNAYTVPKSLSAVKVPEGFGAISYFVKGKQRFLAIELKAANTINNLDRVELNGFAKALNAVNAVFRLGVITLSAGFQVKNMIIDTVRSAAFSRYGLIAGKDVLDSVVNAVLFVPQYMNAIMVAGAANLAGKYTDLYKEFMQSKAYSSGMFDDPFLTKNKELKVGPKSFFDHVKYGGIDKLFNIIEGIGKTFEQSHKIVSMERGMDIEAGIRLGVSRWKNIISKAKTPGDMVAAFDKIAYETQNFAGSPNFPATHGVMKVLSVVFQFLSARVKGEMTDYRRIVQIFNGNAEGVKMTFGERAHLLAQFVAVTLPIVLMAIKNNMGDDDDDRELNTISPYDLDNNILIPSGEFEYIDDYGRMVPHKEFVKIPLRGVTSTINVIANNFAKYAKTKDPELWKHAAIATLANASPFTLHGKNTREYSESLKANFTPVLKADYELTANRDAFRHRDIVPETFGKTSLMGKYENGMKPQFIATRKTPQWAVDLSTYLCEDAGISITPIHLDYMHRTFLGGVGGNFKENVIKKNVLRSESNYPVYQDFGGMKR